jgi:hypothetical protein
VFTVVTPRHGFGRPFLLEEGPSGEINSRCEPCNIEEVVFVP